MIVLHELAVDVRFAPKFVGVETLEKETSVVSKDLRLQYQNLWEFCVIDLHASNDQRLQGMASASAHSNAICEYAGMQCWLEPKDARKILPL